MTSNSIIIFIALLLALLSFWGLGYAYVRFQTHLRTEERRISTLEKKTNQKLKALDKKRVLHQSRVDELNAKIAQISSNN
jgi:hypothetical protein